MLLETETILAWPMAAIWVLFVFGSAVERIVVGYCALQGTRSPGTPILATTCRGYVHDKKEVTLCMTSNGWWSSGVLLNCVRTSGRPIRVSLMFLSRLMTASFELLCVPGG